MQPTRLYLIRHGQTDWNASGLLQGQTNIPLNETGRQQAQAAKGRLCGICFDAVYSSPLDRALETAALCSGWPADRICADERIKEISFGPWEGHAPRDLGPDFAPFFADPASYHPTVGGESFEQLIARVSNFLTEIKSKHAGQTILAASHGAALHALLTHELRLNMKDFWSISLGNCAVAALELEGDRFVLKNIIGPTNTNYLEKYLK